MLGVERPCGIVADEALQVRFSRLDCRLFPMIVDDCTCADPSVLRETYPTCNVCGSDTMVMSNPYVTTKYHLRSHSM
jgi:hypothetical protein